MKTSNGTTCLSFALTIRLQQESNDSSALSLLNAADVVPVVSESVRLSTGGDDNADSSTAGGRSSTEFWYARLNADLPATDVDSTTARVSGELAALAQSTDFDAVIDGSDHVIAGQYEALRQNIEAVVDECRPSEYQDLIRCVTVTFRYVASLYRKFSVYACLTSTHACMQFLKSGFRR